MRHEREIKPLNSRVVTPDVTKQPQIINKACEAAHMTELESKRLQK